MTDLFILIGGDHYHLGLRSAMLRNNQVYHILCSRTTDVLLDEEVNECEDKGR